MGGSERTGTDLEKGVKGVRGKRQVIRGIRQREIYRDECPRQKQRRKHGNSLHYRIIPLRPTSNKMLLRQHLILIIQHPILVLLGFELVVQSLLSSVVRLSAIVVFFFCEEDRYLFANVSQ